MKSSKKKAQPTKPSKRGGKARTVSFRCPEEVLAEARLRVEEEGIDFSKLVRRAVRKAMGRGKPE